MKKVISKCLLFLGLISLSLGLSSYGFGENPNMGGDQTGPWIPWCPDFMVFNYETFTCEFPVHDLPGESYNCFEHVSYGGIMPVRQCSDCGWRHFASSASGMSKCRVPGDSGDYTTR